MVSPCVDIILKAFVFLQNKAAPFWFLMASTFVSALKENSKKISIFAKYKIVI